MCLGPCLVCLLTGGGSQLARSRQPPTPLWHTVHTHWGTFTVKEGAWLKEKTIWTGSFWFYKSGDDSPCLNAFFSVNPYLHSESDFGNLKNFTKACNFFFFPIFSWWKRKCHLGKQHIGRSVCLLGFQNFQLSITPLPLDLQALEEPSKPASVTEGTALDTHSEVLMLFIFQIYIWKQKTKFNWVIPPPFSDVLPCPAQTTNRRAVCRHWSSPAGPLGYGNPPVCEMNLFSSFPFVSCH